MKPSLLLEDSEDAQLKKLVQGYFAQGDHNKELEVIEDLILIRGKENVPGMVHYLQGSFFFQQATKQRTVTRKFPFLLASVECFLQDCGVNAYSAIALLEMAKQLGSVSFYRKALNIEKEGLSLLACFGGLSLSEGNTKSSLENVVQAANSMILFLLGDLSLSEGNTKSSLENLVQAAESMIPLGGTAKKI